MYRMLEVRSEVVSLDLCFQAHEAESYGRMASEY